ncbi:MAG TPA: hypothetical protein VGD91_23550 [Trebonia sp.]
MTGGPVSLGGGMSTIRQWSGSSTVIAPLSVQYGFSASTRG